MAGNFVPPSDAEVVKPSGGFTPPSDAIVVEPEKKNLGSDLQQPSAQVTQPFGENWLNSALANHGIEIPDVTKSTSPAEDNLLNPLATTIQKVKQATTDVKDIIGDKTVGVYVHDKSIENLDHLNNYNHNVATVTQIQDNPNVKQYAGLVGLYNKATTPAEKDAIKKQMDEIKNKPFALAIENPDLLTGTQIKTASEDSPWPVPKDLDIPITKDVKQLQNGKATVSDALDVLQKSVTQAKDASASFQQGNAELEGVKTKMRDALGFKVGDKGYKELGAFDSFVNGVSNTLNSSVFGASLFFTKDPEKRLEMIKNQIGQQELFPQKAGSTLGMLTENVGAIAPYMIPGVGIEQTGATALTKTIGNVLVNSSLMGSAGYGQGAIQAFSEAKGQGMDDNAALQAADRVANVSGATGVITGGVMSFLPHGETPDNLFDFVKGTVSKNAPIGGLFALNKFVENKAAQQVGLNRDTWDGVSDNFKAAVIMGGMLDGVVYGAKTLPPQVTEAYRNTIAKYGFTQASDALERGKLDGTIDPPTANDLQQDLTTRAAAFNAMPPDLTPEMQVKILPDVQALHDANAELKKAKENNMPTEAIEAKIEGLQNGINEKTGAPLTFDEQKELHDLVQRKNEAGDPESKADKLSPVEKDRLAHLEARQEAAKVNEAEKTKSPNDETGTKTGAGELGGKEETAAGLGGVQQPTSDVTEGAKAEAKPVSATIEDAFQRIEDAKRTKKSVKGKVAAASEAVKDMGEIGEKAIFVDNNFKDLVERLKSMKGEDGDFILKVKC